MPEACRPQLAQEIRRYCAHTLVVSEEQPLVVARHELEPEAASCGLQLLGVFLEQPQQQENEVQKEVALGKLAELVECLEQIVREGHGHVVHVYLFLQQGFEAIHQEGHVV